VTLVKHVRDGHRSSRQDQRNNNNLVQLPLLLDFKHQNLYIYIYSLLVVCRLCVDGNAMSMNAASLFVLLLWAGRAQSV